MARTLTLRLDDETDEALQERMAEAPGRPIAEVIREAIAERGACVYFVRRSDGAVKIGFTASLRSRLSSLRSEYGDITLEALMPGGRPEEAAAHKTFAKQRLGRTEWFRGEPVEAEIRRLVETWGPADVSQGREAFKTINVRFPHSVIVDLEARAARLNAQFESESGARITVGSMVTHWILQNLRGAPPPVSEPSPPLAAPTNGRVGVEVTVARPTHTRRPVATPEATARPPVMGRAQDLDIQREAAERSAEVPVIPNGNGHHPVDGPTEEVDAEGSGLTDDDVADMLKDAPL